MVEHLQLSILAVQLGALFVQLSLPREHKDLKRVYSNLVNLCFGLIFLLMLLKVFVL